MNIDPEIEKLRESLLYEGYALFPYRKNALKNQKRFNFGVLSPRTWAESQVNETYFQQTEFIVFTKPDSIVAFQTRFLHIPEQTGWQTAEERTIENSFTLKHPVRFEINSHGLSGEVTVTPDELGDHLYKVRFRIDNLTGVLNAQNASREEILSFSFISTHTVFHSDDSEFISLLEPPQKFAEHSSGLTNIGAFPVLIGDRDKKNSLLASPIILYDFPEASQNSFDNFFDGLEIDELMVLSVLALTEAEKREIASTDEKARIILERIENASPEELMKLHAKMSFR